MATTFTAMPDFDTSLNAILIYKPHSDTTVHLAFHPFIESFKHTLTPKITEEEFGLFAVTTYYQSGVAKNTYQIGIALPSIDDEHASDNYEKVIALKKLADPHIQQLQDDTGIVRLQVGNLIPHEAQVGYITAVDETIDIEQGFSSEGFPKLIKVVFTFAVDGAIRAIRARNLPKPAAAVVNDPDPGKPAADTAGQAKKKKSKNAVEAAADLKKGVATTKKPCK